MTSPTRPDFATNNDDSKVADAISGFLSWYLEKRAGEFELWVAAPYFNPGGFGLVADEIEQVPSVRLLLGAEPDSGLPRPRRLDRKVPPGRAEVARIRNALAVHEHDLQQDRDLLGFDVDADGTARRLVEWLRSGRVEVKRYEEGFLHGKAFLVADEGVVAGSSNFTYAGLAKNRELNLGHYGPHVVGQVHDWFEELWGAAVPYDLAGLYSARYEPHNPYLIYLKMLLERYGRELEEEAVGDDGRIRLTQFGEHGVLRAQRILDRYHGVLVADGVGLGKTFLGGKIVEQVVRERRQRALVIAPAALRDGMWTKFLHDHMLAVECISFEQLADDRQVGFGTRNHLRSKADEYALVVIDEAHAVRSPDTLRAAALRKLLAGTPPKDLVMLTATPVNNSLWDLYYLLSYFVKNDAAFADVGIRSLRAHFAEAMAEDPEALSPDRLFDVIDAVAVRRTRHFVKKYYPTDKVRIRGRDITISFPEPKVVRVEYDLDEVLPGFFPELAHALDCDGPQCPDPDRRSAHPGAVGKPVLSLARYGPTRFLRGWERIAAMEGEAGESVRRRLAAEGPLAGLLRSGLLKRFESSAHAFAATCRRMAASHADFLTMLDVGKVATGEALAEWTRSDSDELDDFLDRWGDTVDDAADYDVENLAAAVEADRRLLLQFAERAEAIDPADDPKLARMREILADIADEATAEAIGPDDERDKRKVIAFSHFTDTAAWLHEQLGHVLEDDPRLAAYRDRTVLVSGSDGDKSDALFGFAPKSSDAPEGADADRYDLLVSTDVLAEGVNLQQARHIVNYDLPWNPMRIVQRHGRIDRIGSEHDKVFLRCFFPDRRLDDILVLEQRLQAKIARAARSVGVEGEVLPGSETGERVFADTREQIEQIHREEAGIFEAGGERGHAYSGEEYRQELRLGLHDPDMARRLDALPWGSGSGLARRGALPGFVFCARVGDHRQPIFRYVELGDETAIVRDTLAALSHAYADTDTPRVLSDTTHSLAYDAWAMAREDILSTWLEAVDPSTFQPRVPKTMRDAADLVRRNPPSGMDQSEVDRVVTILEAPYGARIQRMFREAMRSAESDRDATEAVVALVREQGLQPPVSPEPLPVISLEDVHLVCWQAILPE